MDQHQRDQLQGIAERIGDELMQKIDQEDLSDSEKVLFIIEIGNRIVDIAKKRIIANLESLDGSNNVRQH